MTLAQWDKEVADSRTDELVARYNAILELKNWATFHAEFK